MLCGRTHLAVTAYAGVWLFGSPVVTCAPFLIMQPKPPVSHIPLDLYMSSTMEVYVCRRLLYICVCVHACRPQNLTHVDLYMLSKEK